LDERWFAEGCAEEADSHRQAEEIAQRHVDDWVSADGGEVGRAEEEAVGEDQVGGPGGGAGGRYDAIEVEPAERQVDAIYCGQAINLESLVVGEAAEGWLRIVRAGG